MAKFFLILAAISGATGVMLGAFGAHALRGKLSDYLLGIYQTGVLYQFVHTLALLAVALLLLRYSHITAFFWSAGLFVLGVVLFSGSLYALAFGAPKILGVVTPVGGTALISGWLALAYGATKIH